MYGGRLVARLLLGSGGFRTAERVAFLAERMQAHFGAVDRVLFVPYALADHDGYVTMLTERGLHAGYELDGIHRHPDPVAAIEQATAIYVGGGNTFRLVNELHARGLLEPIRARVAAARGESLWDRLSSRSIRGGAVKKTDWKVGPT
jgi:peptidase E